MNDWTALMFACLVDQSLTLIEEGEPGGAE